MTIIHKLLVANRGEIACRVMHTAAAMGIITVAVYSDADANAKHVQQADEAVYIGANAAHDSYLNAEKIINAAKRTGANAIHPGYGFLSENSTFAQAVIDAGLIWVGASPAAIEAMGDKRRAKLLLKDVPLVPGYNGDDQSDKTFITAANEIGFPIMVKAAAGGGGKGMRAVHSVDELPEALQAARREASQAFGDSTLILERLIQNPRHIEIQIIGDAYGKVVSLGERECSIQRRHQKVIEEAPSPAVDADLRARMSAVAVSIGEQLNYSNAGTIEFLVDVDKNFYFMEMNTRLQVEHRVTELISPYGDLVRLQLEIAQGKPLSEHNFTPQRHAIEVRVYAENPSNEFLPTNGKILKWNVDQLQAHALIDNGVNQGDTVTTFYDPLLAKIIVTGDDRADALKRLDHVLAQTVLLGVQHNVDFLRRVVKHPSFAAGEIDTGFITRHAELVQAPETPPTSVLIAAGIAKTGDLSNHWRNNPYRSVRQTFQFGEQSFTVSLTNEVRNPHVYRVTLSVGERTNTDLVNVNAQNGQTFDIIVNEHDAQKGELTFSIDGYRQTLSVIEGADQNWWIHSPHEGTFKLTWVSPLPASNTMQQNTATGSLRAPMPGTIIAVHAQNGQHVNQGEVLLVIEAMKMEHRIKAPHAGMVAALHLEVGQYIQEGIPLLELQTSEQADPI